MWIGFGSPRCSPPWSQSSACSSEECNAHYPTPLYNVNATGTQPKKPFWVCVDHIPKDMLNPIGLHGEEFKRWKGK
jgi:hypothetical protein